MLDLEGGSSGDWTRINRLFYGDNLTIMQKMPTACVDLIYLDPPFNSQRNYNLIYKQRTGFPVPEQEEAFCDAWELDAEKRDMALRMPIVLRNYDVDEGLVRFWEAWIDALKGTQPRLLAYLVYMTYRLFEMRRILKPKGSIYLHCDPTASHYIKVMMDGVFGHTQFQNEIIWQRTNAKGHASTRLPSTHDVILAYRKSSEATWNPAYLPHSQNYIKSHYSNVEEETGRRYTLDNCLNPNPERPNLTYEWNGHTRVWRWTRDKMQKLHEEGRLVYTKSGMPRYKRYLDEMKGTPLTSVWTDIPPINSQAEERLGYPTQKPIKLLDRIIRLSSKEGDVVFDPFCGCGTAIYAAHLAKRRWIGCDIAILSIGVVREVLLKRYGLNDGEHYETDGIPMSQEGAEELFEKDPRQFEHWAVELAGGFCNKKQSGDRGVDGRIYFETNRGLRSMVLSVKGGNLTPAYVRELRGVVERERDAEMAGFICLRQPTKGMRQEAAEAGMYTYQDKGYPRLQIRTVAELLQGKGFDTPSKIGTMNWQKQSVLPL